MKKIFDILILLVSFIFVLILLEFLGFEFTKLPEMLKKIGILPLIFLLLITFLEVIIKAYRFNLTLKKPLKITKVLWPYFRATYLSYFVPVRLLGEGVKAPIFKKHCNISYTQSLASISIERLTDMLLITFIALYAVSYINPIISGLLLFSFIIFILIMRSELPIKTIRKLPENKVFDFVFDYSKTLNLLFNNPIKMFKVSVLTLFAWGVAFGRMWLILILLGENINFFNAVSASAIAYLVSLLSILPGGLVGFEGGGIAALVLMGITKEMAMFTIFIERIFSFWLFVIIGIIIEIKNKL
jgi:uncharacterized protein (TIRG00374 family)